MKSKLVLIEGLPGSGKSTTARLVHDILTDRHIGSQLFLEGNPEHPADYEGVALFTQKEWDECWSACGEHRELLSSHMIRRDDWYFLEYRKLADACGPDFPEDLLHTIAAKDIYELPLDENRRQVTEKWRTFAESARNGPDIFIFECCFIQNPVTVGMIKYGAERRDVIGYVEELASAVARLNPLLIYVEQSDLDYSFRKAVRERPAAWSEGLIDYYTNQGYGKQHGFEGLDGTLRVLEARLELERIIFDGLPFAKIRVDNSSYRLDEYKRELAALLSARLFPG